MKKPTWENDLTKIDQNLKKLKTVTKQVNKLEHAYSKHGSNIDLKRKMTLTNFDDFVDDALIRSQRSSKLDVIPEDKPVRNTTTAAV